MANDQRENPRLAWNDVLNRAVIKRCVITGLLTIPGVFYGKGGTSIDTTLASALLGCVVMVIASMPLNLLVSSTKYTQSLSFMGKSRNHKYLVVVTTISSVGVVIAVIHGTFLAPASFFQLAVIIPLAASTALLTWRAMQETLTMRSMAWIEAIVISSGALYGAITGATTFPTMLLIGTGAIASGFFSRGMFARAERLAMNADIGRSAWATTLTISVVTSLFALLAAPALMPMILPVLASGGSMLAALYISKKTNEPPRSRAMVQRLISLALFCVVLAIFTGSV